MSLWSSGFCQDSGCVAVGQAENGEQRPQHLDQSKVVYIVAPIVDHPNRMNGVFGRGDGKCGVTGGSHVLVFQR